MCDRLKMGRRVENVDNVEKMQKIEKKSKKAVDIFINLYYTYVRNRDEAWLSLVERCVRDAEVASSNLVASTYLNTKACWSSGAFPVCLTCAGVLYRMTFERRLREG